MQTQTQNRQEEKLYKTADLYFAAYLSVAGCPIEDLRKQGRQCTMHFRDEGQIDELRKQFYNRKAKITALDFTQEIKMIKSRIAEVMAQEE